MTTAGTAPTNGAGTLKPKDRLALARKLYDDSVAAGSPLTGDELAQHLSVTDRWGRKLISRFKAEAAESRPNGRRPEPKVRLRDGIAESRETVSENRGGSSAQPEPTRLPRDEVGPASDAVSNPSMGNRDDRSGCGGRPSWLDATITLVVALVAAAASYGHMLHVATLAGEPLWIARAFPITVDGLVLAAIRRGKDGRGWLILGAAVSVAANVLAQFPEHATTIGPVVSAWPPIALYGTHRLLHDRNDRRSR